MKTKFLTFQYSGGTPLGFVPGSEINRWTAKYKYGGDPMAEYLDMLAGDGGQDDETGEVDWQYWVAKFGKRLLFTDDRGFVWVEKYKDEVSAKGVFESIGEEYGDWLNENDEGMM